MSLHQRFAQATIKAGKRLLKGTSLESSPVIGALYRAITRLGYSPSSQIVFHGLELEIDSSDRSMNASLLNGTYEEDELKFLKSTLQPGWIVLDVGANIGIYSALASKLVGPKGKIFAFEPLKELHQILEKNLAKNQCLNVTLIKKAVGETSGQTVIYVDQNRGSSSTLVETSRPFEVPRISLNEFCQENQIKPNFIKIDIEGAELSALRGANRLEHTLVMFEYNPLLLKKIGHNPEDIIKYALSRFKNLSLISRGGTLTPVTAPSDLSHHALVNLVGEM